MRPAIDSSEVMDDEDDEFWEGVTDEVLNGHRRRIAFAKSLCADPDWHAIADQLQFAYPAMGNICAHWTIPAPQWNHGPHIRIEQVDRFVVAWETIGDSRLHPNNVSACVNDGAAVLELLSITGRYEDMLTAKFQQLTAEEQFGALLETRRGGMICQMEALL